MIHLELPRSLLAVISYWSESFVVRSIEALSWPSDGLRIQEMSGEGLPTREYESGYESKEVPVVGDQSLQCSIFGLSEKEHWKHRTYLAVYFKSISSFFTCVEDGDKNNILFTNNIQ